MKKLLFATAIAASAAAFADPINAISFESYNNGVSIPGENGRSESNEFGTGPFFYFQGESNSSVVSNDATAASADKRTAYFAEANNAKYLALDTEGGTLWRLLDTIGSVTDQEGGTNIYSFCEAQPVAATGTYLDTLVQFTVTEDDAPTVGADDKLAIWLQAGEGTTNLMVKAAVVDDQGGRTETTFTVTGTTVAPGTWYRLTVKAIADITDTDGIPGFQIFLDGNLVTANTPTVTTEYLDLLSNDSHYADIVAGKYFASLKTTTTLQGVGFQGTGAVDEIVWTEDNPFPAEVVEFTLTYSGDSNTTLGAVTYTLDGGEAQTPTEGKIPDGALVSIAAPTFTEGYQIAALTVDGTAVANPVFPYSFTMTADTTVAITSEQTPASYPTYIDTTDAAIKAKYDAWKTKVSYDDSTANSHLNQFLLDVDEETTVGNAALEITEIKQNATAGWDITIGCSLDGVGLTGTVGETIVCNGYLAVSYTDSLTGTWTTENIPVTAVDATTGTVTVNVNKANAKFMKVTLTAAPQPAANN